MKLKGTIDMVQLENGLNQITFDLKKVDATSASVNSDFERMNQQANRLAIGLGLIGASAALLNLAKNAPQIAPAMASINLSMFKLGMTLGNILKPAFDTFASKLNWLVDEAAAHPDITKGITDGLILLSLAMAGFKISTAFAGFMAFLPEFAAYAGGIYAVYESLKSIYDLVGSKKSTTQDILQLTGTAAGGIGGFALGGPMGAMAGAGAGSWMGKNALGPNSMLPAIQILNIISGIMSLINKDQSKKYYTLGLSDLTGR